MLLRIEYPDAYIFPTVLSVVDILFYFLIFLSGFLFFIDLSWYAFSFSVCVLKVLSIASYCHCWKYSEGHRKRLSGNAVVVARA